MKRALVALFAALCLSGCNTFKDMDAGINSLVGQNIDVAFQRLGYPNQEGQLAGKTVYVWGVSRQSNMTLFTPRTTTGYVGATPFSYTTNTITNVPIREECTLRVFVDPATKLITYSDWEGNIAGCQRYAGRIKPR